MAAPYVYWLLPVLFCSVKERDDLTTCAVLIDAKRPLLRPRRIARRYLLLISPEDRVVERVALRHVPEWGS